jgi:hypothetical protein
MASLQLTITDVGRAALVNAQNTGSAPLVLSEVAIGDAVYTPDGTETALGNEIKRIGTIAGGAVSDDIIHVTISDESADTYTFYEFGLYTDTGVLFAVYSQTDPLMIKATSSSLLMAVDIAFIDVTATDLAFPDPTFNNPPASTLIAGIVRLQNSQTETNPAVALRVGSFGIGEILAVADADLALFGGLYSLAAGSANAPIADTAGVLAVVNGGDDVDYIHQTWNLSDTLQQGRTFVRHFDGTTWSDWLEIGGANAITLDGALTIYPGTSGNTYLITNFDAFSTYAIESQGSDATGVLVGDTLTVDVNINATENQDWPITISRNGVATDYLIQIGAAGVDAPTITSPSEAQTDVVETATIYADPFDTFPTGYDTHASSQWQISDDAGFSNIVFDSLGDAVNLTEIPIPEGELAYLTTYYARVRYTGSLGKVSDWSATRTFTTRKEPLPTSEIAKLLASDGAASDNAGYTVDMSGDGQTALVCAMYDDGGRGSAYIWKLVTGTWQQHQKLTATDRNTNHYFGCSGKLNYDGSRVIIGAYGNEAAYLFEESGGTYSQIKKFTATDGYSGALYAWSSDLDSLGTTVVIGAKSDDGLGNNAGAVYVYTDSSGTWPETKVTTAAGDGIGTSVSISDNGLRFATGGIERTSDQGCCYVFEFTSSWGQIALLIPSGLVNYDRVGRFCAISGNGLAVAFGGLEVNKVWIYSDTGSWNQDYVINGTFSSHPQAVDINADATVVITTKNISTGSFAVFMKTLGVWAEFAEVYPTLGAAGDQFGCSSGISDDGKLGIIGAKYDDDKGADAGAGYIFG